MVFNEAKVKYTITVSHELSQIGLLEREAASLMNASLLQLAERTIASFQEALRKMDMKQCYNTMFLT
jgi:N-methylhydantoinase A/oxoprolinase/acetone carboxylase beta subunit